MFAVLEAERIDRWRRTPSKCSLQEVYPERERVQPLRRVVRKHNRRVADAKRRMEREKLSRRFFAWLAGKEIEE